MRNSFPIRHSRAQPKARGGGQFKPVRFTINQ
jgi:hypothetical protein